MNEIEALATKAARGAGAPAGQAARFGAAAAKHLQAGRAPNELSQALANLPNGPILTYPLALDQALSNLSGGKSELRAVQVTPLLRSYVACLPFAAELVGSTEQTIMHVDLTRPAERVALRRISGCDDLIAELTVFAARTFVPETDTSRLAGAGAGLTDND